MSQNGDVDRLTDAGVSMRLFIVPAGFLTVLASFVLVARTALAVDFAIDVPKETGVRPEDALDDEIFIDLPPSPPPNSFPPAGSKSSDAVKVLPPKRENASGGGVVGYFPTPACLAENIRLWEMVYRDVDSNSVVFHDRDRLGRIYGIAALPASLSARRSATELYTTYFVNKLRELAQMFDTPSRWDKTHRELAKHFAGADFNANAIYRASSNIRLQTGLSNRFEEGIQRSLQYIPTVHRILTDNGLPSDIMILPHVESGYHPRAVSKVGAVGLWQIMPGTMRLLLGRDFVNRRTEIEPATRAAAKLLRQNFGATQSWPLALTAYNHGLNGVLRGIRTTGSRDFCTILARYESPTFKFASSNFYAQFLAARNVSMVRYGELAKNQPGSRGLRSLLASRAWSGSRGEGRVE
jgi:hypothetical protein